MERGVELLELTRLGALEAALRVEIRTQIGILRSWRQHQAGWLEKGAEKQAGICAFQAHATRVALESLLLVRKAGRR